MQLLKRLPAGNGMALVPVQHLDPSHGSALPAVLARSTSMPVVEARNNMLVVPNRLHVLPPNKLMGIADRRLKLSPLGSEGTLSPIDHFLRALASEAGSRGIGLLLSGTGSDGTQGLLAVKAAGGITFAQAERFAGYPAMPGSAITSGCVDFVLAPGGIARELTRIAGHPYVRPSGVEAEEAESALRPAAERVFESILLALRHRTGVDFSQYKSATLRRRIQRRMLLHKHDSLREYSEYLRAHPVEVQELYADILITVLWFEPVPAGPPGGHRG